MKLKDLKDEFERDKNDLLIINKNVELDLESGDEFILKVGRNYRRIKVNDY